MKPKKPDASESLQLRLFQARLDSQLNLDHPLVILAGLIDWERFDEAYAPLFCPDNGAPALPTRLMVGIEYLKYAYDLSDEAVVMRWLENPYWQYFCGETYFQIELPLHYTSLGPPKAVLLTLPRRCVNSLTMLAGVFERRGRSFFR